MQLLRDVSTLDIKEPSFDRPEGTDTARLSIAEGTRVCLSHHGNVLSAQVEAIERLGTSFVGCVRVSAAHDELSPGDHIRFRLKDVCWTE